MLIYKTVTAYLRRISMKRIGLACLLTLFGSLSLRAADAPRSAPPAVAPPPAICSLGSFATAWLPPKPSFKAVVPPPCYAMTNCPDGSTVMCPHVSNYANCNSSDGCWVECEEGFLFCPGQESKPECSVY
jgi:hypothetical protein